LISPPYIESSHPFTPLDEEKIYNDRFYSGKMTAVYMGAALKIDRNDLLKVVFKNENTMYLQESIKSRDQKLYMAMLMGNNYYDNVRILFNTEDGVREVISRIWARTDKFVVLKGGMFIPIGALVDIILE